MGNRGKIRTLSVALVAIVLGSLFQAPATAHRGHTAAQEQLFDLINAGRKARRKPANVEHSVIQRLEQGHANWMARRRVMSHAGYPRRRTKIQNSDGGISVMCENVAYSGGRRSAAMKTIYRLWVRSRVHNRCMFRRGIRSADVGVARSADGIWYAAFISAQDRNPGCNVNDPCR